MSVGLGFVSQHGKTHCPEAKDEWRLQRLCAKALWYFCGSASHEDSLLSRKWAELSHLSKLMTFFSYLSICVKIWRVFHPRDLK